MISYDRKKAEQLAVGLQCEKDLKCLTDDNLLNLCRVEKTDDGLRIKCLEVTQASECNFAAIYDKGFLCMCPLRCFFAQELGH